MLLKLMVDFALKLTRKQNNSNISTNKEAKMSEKEVIKKLLESYRTISKKWEEIYAEEEECLKENLTISSPMSLNTICEICGEEANVFPPDAGRSLCKKCYEFELEEFNKVFKTVGKESIPSIFKNSNNKQTQV